MRFCIVPFYLILCQREVCEEVYGNADRTGEFFSERMERETSMGKENGTKSNAVTQNVRHKLRDGALESLPFCD